MAFWAYIRNFFQSSGGPKLNYFHVYYLQYKFLKTGTIHTYIFLQVKCLIIHDGFDHPHQVNQ